MTCAAWLNVTSKLFLITYFNKKRINNGTPTSKKKIREKFETLLEVIQDVRVSLCACLAFEDCDIYLFNSVHAALLLQMQESLYLCLVLLHSCEERKNVVLSVCPLWESHVTITHDALDLTVQGVPPPPPRRPKPCPPYMDPQPWPLLYRAPLLVTPGGQDLRPVQTWGAPTQVLTCGR